MPQIPNQIVPQYNPQGGGIGFYEAPVVAPTENYAAVQTQRMGQAMTSMGEAAYKLAQQEEDLINESNARAADTASMAAMTIPLDEYLETANEDAINGYQGVVADIRAKANEAMDSLANPQQKAMLQPSLERRVAMMEQQARQHYTKQGKAWNAATSASRADTLLKEAARIGSFLVPREMVVSEDGLTITPQTGPLTLSDLNLDESNASLGAALDELRNMFKAKGISETSPLAQDALKVARGQVAAGIVSALMERHDYSLAEEYLDSVEHGNTIDGDTRIKLRTDVTKAMEQYHIESFVDSLIAFNNLSTPEDRERDHSFFKLLSIEQRPTLRQMMATAEKGISNPAILAGVKAKLPQVLGAKIAIERYDQDVAYGEVADIIEAGTPVSDVMANTALWGRMSRSQQAELLKPLQAQRAADRDAYSVDRLALYTEHPEALTREVLTAERPHITPETYKALALKLANYTANPMAVSFDANTLTDMLNTTGLGRLNNAKGANADARNKLDAEVRAQIDAWQRSHKKEPDELQKKKIMLDSITRYRDTVIRVEPEWNGIPSLTSVGTAYRVWQAWEDPTFAAGGDVLLSDLTPDQAKRASMTGPDGKLYKYSEISPDDVLVYQQEFRKGQGYEPSVDQVLRAHIRRKLGVSEGGFGSLIRKPESMFEGLFGP